MPSSSPRRHLYSRNSRSAFTLLEILIVLVIIAQLAAILLPVFSKVRETARRSVCQSNLKQIGLAIEQYAQDYEDRYPSVVIDTTANTVKDTWSLLMPYAKSEALFVCPSDSRPVPTDPIACPKVGTCLSDGRNSSYGFNTGGAWGGVSGVPGKPTRMAGIFPLAYPEGSRVIYQGAARFQTQTPETVFVAADGYGSRPLSFPGMNSLTYRSYPSSTYPATQSGWRHGNWRNTLYVDGHVKAVRWNSYSFTDGYPVMYPRSDRDLAGLCFTTDVTVYGGVFGNPPGYDCAADIKTIADFYMPRKLPE